MNWVLVRILDPYGNPLSEAGAWANHRDPWKVKELRELANGWYFGGPILRGLSDATALHPDCTMESIPPLFFLQSRPLALSAVHMLENDASLEGFVTDSITQQPIFPAHVTVLRAPPDNMDLLYGATYANPTDESGHFYYPMASGFYDGLYVSADGYEGFLVRPYNAPDGASTLNFTLTPSPESSAEPGETVRIQINRK